MTHPAVVARRPADPPGASSARLLFRMLLRPALVAIGTCCLAAGPTGLTAQVPRILKGRVVAEGTRRPLAGAEVVLMDLGRLARTGLSGTFELSVPPPPYRVKSAGSAISLAATGSRAGPIPWKSSSCSSRRRSSWTPCR